jgi:hypothetical protein
MIAKYVAFPALLALAFGASYGRIASSTNAAPSVTPEAVVVHALVEPRRSSSKLIQDLALLATGRTPSSDILANDTRALEDGSETIPQVVDKLLHGPDFGEQVAPGMLVGGLSRPTNFAAFPEGFILMSSADGETGESPSDSATDKVSDTRVYYLRGQGPCSRADAVSVQPWWDMAHAIRVCSSSYRPNYLGEASGEHRCGSTFLRAGDACGCGPNLAYCTRSAAHQASTVSSLQHEVTETIAYVVNADQPIADAFLQNETFQDATAAFVDRRWKLQNGEAVDLTDLVTWPKGGKWAPRSEAFPGQHAGVLTTSAMMFKDAPRTNLRDIYDMVWCMGVKSVDVSVEAVLDLKGKDLRLGDGWQELAAKPVCTNCHARLDYGMQFFLGYRTPIHAVDFVPGDHRTGRGPLYAEDISDSVGEGELTPHGFAELAVEQDRFASCMVHRVKEHVFGADAEPGDTASLMAVFKKAKTLKSVMRAALEIYGGRHSALVARPDKRMVTESVTASNHEEGPARPPEANTGESTVPVPPVLRAELDAHCLECHDADGRQPNMLGSRLSASSIASMLSQVAFFGMPKTETGLPPEVRKQMVKNLVSLLWPVGKEQREAIDYFGNGLRSPPVHRIAPMMGLIRERAGASRAAHSKFSGFLVESVVPQEVNRYTPGVAALAAFEALAACSSTQQGDGVSRCFEEATDPDELVPLQ